MEPSSPEQSAAAVVQRIIGVAAIRGEVALSYCRLVFCAGVLLRYFFLGHPLPWQAYALNVAVLSLGMAFSVLVLSRQRCPSAHRIIHWAGPLDALVCFLSLLHTVIWAPHFGVYRGLLTVPDVLIVPLLMFAATFRLSVRQTLLSGLLNGAGMCALISVEQFQNSVPLGYDVGNVSIFALLFATVGFTSVLLARRTQSLVESAALDTVRVERARRDLSTLLREHHDATSLISAATLNLDALSRTLVDPAPEPPGSTLAALERVRRDLASISQLTRGVSEHAFGQLAVLRSLEPLDTTLVVPATLDVLRRRFPDILFRAELHALPCICLAGGAASLQRIIYNLVANAVEGNGAVGAHNVGVSTRVCGERLLLQVEDDGPGLAHAQLSPALGSCLSTKALGSGLGLFALRQLLELSDGRLTAANRDGGGALLTLDVPLLKRGWLGSGHEPVEAGRFFAGL